ncbi:uncharacterized protein LOC144504005 isoform X2 [Mustelus asterias]
MAAAKWKASCIQSMSLALLMSPSKRKKVFKLISVDLDISIFGEMSRLAQELEDNYKSLCFSRCPSGRLQVEGSFSAMKELRKDLQRRLDELQEFPSPSSEFKSGASASGGRCARRPSDCATRRTEPQMLAASPVHGASDAMHRAVFKEETSIILDADIFEYIDKRCKDQYEQVLCKHCVRAQVRNCDDISILQLENVRDQCEPFQLRVAKFEIESLINQMQQLLVSERIRLDGGKGQSKMTDIYREIEQRLPLVLVRITDGYVTLIGSSENCSQFKKEVEKKVKAVESMLDSTSSGSSHILNATGYSNHSGQTLSSNTAHGFDVPSKSEYSPNPNSHSGQYTKSQANSSLTVSSRDDSHGKWTSCGVVGPLDTGLSSLPVQLQMGTSTVESKFGSTSSAHSHSLNTTGSPINFGQRLGSNAALAECAHNKSEYSPNPNSHSGQCIKSQAFSSPTVSGREDSFRKWRSPRDIDPLDSGPSSLSASPQMGLGTIYDQPSRYNSRSDKSPKH